VEELRTIAGPRDGHQAAPGQVLAEAPHHLYTSVKRYRKDRSVWPLLAITRNLLLLAETADPDYSLFTRSNRDK
jgi:hypothetical protein